MFCTHQVQMFDQTLVENMYVITMGIIVFDLGM